MEHRVQRTEMDIKEIREKLSGIDAEMAELFVKRMDAVRELAKYRGERGLAIEDREEELSSIAANSAHIEDEDMRSLYISFLQSTMDISNKWQHILNSGLRVACTEWKESAGLRAAKAIMPNCDAAEYKSCREAYEAAAGGECDIAVLPLENSYSGEVGKVYDLIFSGELFVNDVYAVGSGTSTTRYAVLSRIEREFETAKAKEAFLIMFTVKDEIGGLAKAINIISAFDYNMRVMRSRPLKDLPWHYYFYAELEGDCSREKRDRLIRALSAACPSVRVAGHFVADRHVAE